MTEGTTSKDLMLYINLMNDGEKIIESISN